MLLRRVHLATAWLLLAQIGLIGSLGTGLHDLFGCGHGPVGATRGGSECNAVIGVAMRCGCTGDSCPFESRRDAALPGWKAASDCSSNGACSGACAVCDVLGLYQTAAMQAALAVGFAERRFDVRSEGRTPWVSSDGGIAAPRGPPLA